MFVYLRLLLIVALVVFAFYFVRRLYLVSRTNPYLRAYLSRFSWQMARIVALRYLLVFLWRAVRLMRFFR